jgi:hypothetical protein
LTLERAETQHIVEQQVDDLGLFRAVEANLFLAEQLGDDFTNLLRQLLARELRGGGKIQPLHDQGLDALLGRLDEAVVGGGAAAALARRGLVGLNFAFLGRGRQGAASNQPVDEVGDQRPALQEIEVFGLFSQVVGNDLTDPQRQFWTRQRANVVVGEGLQELGPYALFISADSAALLALTGVSAPSRATVGPDGFDRHLCLTPLAEAEK